MGSVGNQNPWAPYGSYKDCSQGICSIYCPQWCYIVFSPPPPSFGTLDVGSGTNFSPLIIAVIGILASAFLLVSYFTVISKYCRRRGGDHNPTVEFDENRNQMSQEAWQVASTGLDEALIKSITVCKYKKGDGLVEGTDCSVCLNEFQEDESLRLLPNCHHAFHLPCIDMWLKSHSSCPLCRSNVACSNPLPLPAPGSQSPVTFNISSSLEIQRRNDALLVVDHDLERGHQEEVVVSIVSEVIPKNPAFQAIDAIENSEERDNIIDVKQEGLQRFRRSVSLDSSSCQCGVFIADILHTDVDDDDYQMENRQFPMGIGSSKRLGEEHGKSNNKNGAFDLVRSPIAMKRSISTGRFMFTKHDKGKKSIIPN